MVREHPQLAIVEHPFIDTYYFGHDAITLRQNERMSKARLRVQADPTFTRTYQECFENLRRSIEDVQRKAGFGVEQP